LGTPAGRLEVTVDYVSCSGLELIVRLLLEVLLFIEYLLTREDLSRFITFHLYIDFFLFQAVTLLNHSRVPVLLVVRESLGFLVVLRDRSVRRDCRKYVVNLKYA
jgi:hypothetical protein